MDAAPEPLRLVSLERLVAAVTTARPDVLDRLTDAMVVAEHLDRTGDALIGHFVEEARSQGISWSDIGHSMGVSKQAAQKRFSAKGHAEDLEPLDPGQGFARFTVETRNAILAAHDAARARGEAT
nr:ATP-dependent Clp protease ATP-binding subunit [Actinomycetota bacterium]